MTGMIGQPGIFSSSDATLGITVANVDPTVNDDSTKGFKIGWHWINIGASPRRVFIAVDVSPGAAVWDLMNTPAVTAVLTKQNKDMVGKVTALDGDKATDTSMASTPINDGYVIVDVNGNIVSVGDGVKTKDCYFSGDGGTTARTIQNIQAGDTCHWVGSVAGYQLDTVDRLNFNYDV